MDGDTVYAVEGRGGGSVAVKAGGKDDVSESQVVWKGARQFPVCIANRLRRTYVLRFAPNHDLRRCKNT